jgi:hypothetical protein
MWRDTNSEMYKPGMSVICAGLGEECADCIAGEKKIVR